jgi:hypothetical protein
LFPTIFKDHEIICLFHIQDSLFKGSRETCVINFGRNETPYSLVIFVIDPFCRKMKFNLSLALLFNTCTSTNADYSRRHSNRARGQRAINKHSDTRGGIHIPRSLDDAEAFQGASISQQVLDLNFERRKKRRKKKKQKKCFDEVYEGELVKGIDYMDCTPTETENFDTDFPTWSPTITPVPTITDFPTKSLKRGKDIDENKTHSPSSASVTSAPNSPVNAPTGWLGPIGSQSPSPFPISGSPETTSLPTDAPFSWFAPVGKLPEIVAACNAIDQGTVYKTDKSFSISYVYELLSSSTFALESVVDALEQQVTSYLASSLVLCYEDRRRVQESLRRHLLVLGVGPDSQDEELDDTCNFLTAAAGETCSTMKGTLSLFLSDADDTTYDEASTEIYNLLKESFNADAESTRSRILQKSGNIFLNADLGILGLHFRGSVQADGPTSVGEVPTKVETATSVDNSRTLYGLGFGVIIVTCIGLSVLALVTMRRRAYQAGESVGDDRNEDESGFPLNTSGKSKEKGVLTLNNTEETERNEPPAEIVSDDDSVFHDLDESFHKHYIHGTGIMQEDLEIRPTFVKAEADKYQRPSNYDSRVYYTRDTVDL